MDTESRIAKYFFDGVSFVSIECESFGDACSCWMAGLLIMRLLVQRA